MKNKIRSILHASFLVADVQQSLRFYTEILGFEVDPKRPEMDYAGAWLKIGYGQQLHLLELPNPDSKERPKHAGHDRHIALQVDSVVQLKELLTQHKIEFTQSKSRANVIFLRDPDLNALEMIGLD